MNMYDDVTTMIELTQEELDSVIGAGFGGYGLGGFGLGGYGLGGYGLGGCGVCGGFGVPFYGGFGLGACGTCGFSSGPYINAVTNSAVNKFAQSSSLASSNAVTNSAFTYYGN